LARNLRGFDLDVMADFELINDEELIATFQPGPPFDGQGHFLSHFPPGQDDRTFTGPRLQATLIDRNGHNLARITYDGWVLYLARITYDGWVLCGNDLRPLWLTFRRLLLRANQGGSN
jgi:hypothetical protein